MMVNQDTTHVERPHQFGEAVDALHGIEVEAEEQLCILQDITGSQLMLGIHHKLTHARDEFQRFGSHVGSDNHDILT